MVPEHSERNTSEKVSAFTFGVVQGHRGLTFLNGAQQLVGIESMVLLHYFRFNIVAEAWWSPVPLLDSH